MPATSAASTPADDPQRRQSGGVIDFDRDFSGLSARWIGRYELGGGRLTATLGLDYETASDDRRGYENFVGQTLGVKGALRRDEVNSATSFDRFQPNHTLFPLVRRATVVRYW